MARKIGLTLTDIVDAAAAVADADGLAGVTLLTVADRLGVRSPSLYAHVQGLEGLRRALAVFAGRTLAAELEDAARGLLGVDAIRAIAAAYRQFASDHPGLYAAAQRATDAHDDRELAEALYAAIVPVLRALDDAGIRDRDEQIHLTRVMRSALHGFVSLEQLGGFGLPADVDASFARLVDLLVVGLGTTPATHH